MGVMIAIVKKKRPESGGRVSYHYAIEQQLENFLKRIDMNKHRLPFELSEKCGENQ